MKNSSNIKFSKYQGAGNDFVMIDQRRKQSKIIGREDAALIAKLCDRRFGIGGDGLILLQKKKGFDFEMIYFNADGRESTMCGNGGRCITAFAADLMRQDSGKFRFWAIDGEHIASFETESPNNYKVWLGMSDVPKIEVNNQVCVLNTGSPHYVLFVSDLKSMDVKTSGQKIRYNDRFKEKGINVNFVELVNNNLHVRTYERGVEDETLACGTGVTACAIADWVLHDKHAKAANFERVEKHLIALGGHLSVYFTPTPSGSFEDVLLVGPAVHVFDGFFVQ